MLDDPGSVPAPEDPDLHAPDPGWVAWLEESSMLRAARDRARSLSGSSLLWERPFALPDPRAAIERAPVWFTTYPAAMLSRPGESFLAALGDHELWSLLTGIGITAVHTGPVKVSGGIEGRERTPSVDGNFDRIGSAIDPGLGTEEDFVALVRAAGDVGGTVIDDIIPGHTGKGPDFRLAELAYEDYPGIYHMVSVPPEHWALLPEVVPGRDSANLTTEQESALAEAGIIVGALQRVIFAEPGVKETNWSATRVVRGVDGVDRRWVYLHIFKEGQPQLNWLDPSFAAARLVLGDLLHSMSELGSRGLRLDANGFLGVERGAPGRPGWSEGHPLSVAANHLVASTVRRLGGFSFQELNLSMDAIRETSARGADLSYDFVTRPGAHHALATGDTEFLRLCYAEASRAGVDTGSLVHALQNHDELTYELVHFDDAHRDETFDFRGRPVTGAALAELVRTDLLDRLTGDAAPYNLPFTTNGIACTTTSVVTASLGLSDLDALTEDDVERVRRAHLLLAAFNAWQPGVIALSGWDLLGVLPLDPEQIGPLLADGDTRWINRGAFDLLGVAGTGTAAGGLPRGRSLYGSLTEQVSDPTSFASRLADILRVRAQQGLATAQALSVADADHAGVLGLVNRLPDDAVAVTVLQFAAQDGPARLRAPELEPGSVLRDVVAGADVAEVDRDGWARVELAGHDHRLLRLV